jgi:hypothetical protein
VLEVNAQPFAQAIDEMARLNAVLSGFTDLNQVVDADLRLKLKSSAELLAEAIFPIGARAALVSAQRLYQAILDEETPLTLEHLRDSLSDIKKRFHDEIGFIKLLVVPPEEQSLMNEAKEHLGSPTSERFLGVSYDVEEAAKCLCFGRPTASVFHSMRVLEVALKAFALRLGIPNPVKPSERNWGNILQAVKTKIDSDYPSSKRLSKSEGAFLEAVYVSLDAIKNPWRNETMHVEGVYTEEEAKHILLNCIALLKKMSGGFDENGQAVTQAALLGDHLLNTLATETSNSLTDRSELKN